LKTNQEIYASLTTDAERLLFNSFEIQACTHCNSLEYVSPKAMPAINPEVMVLLDLHFIKYAGCTFGTGPTHHFSCRKCNQDF
jgi:hypothetical protein